MTWDYWGSNVINVALTGLVKADKLLQLPDCFGESAHTNYTLISRTAILINHAAEVFEIFEQAALGFLCAFFRPFEGWLYGSGNLEVATELDGQTEMVLESPEETFLLRNLSPPQVSEDSAHAVRTARGL